MADKRPELSPNDEQLVIDFAAEYVERWRACNGEGMSMAEWRDKLPTPEMRKVFQETVNLSCFIDVMNKAKKEGLLDDDE